MKIKIYTLILLSLFTAIALRASCQNAYVQFLHDSPDTSLSSADIYINGTMIYNIAFRKATPFTTLPAGILSIGIAHANSSSANDTIKNLNITLLPDSSYYIVLSGLLDTTGFEHNPQGTPINFAINVYTHATRSSVIPYDCDLQFFNGSTDEGTLNLYGREQREMLFTKVAYPQFAPGYKDEVTYEPIIIDFTDATGKKVSATYLANLEGYSQQSALIFSSGFLNTPLNHNGSPFGMFVAFDNGEVVSLADTSIANLQLIHNAADTNAVALDIYINDNLWWPDFYFRTATTYLDVAAGVPQRIGIAPANSSSYTQVFDSFTVTFQNAESYIGFLNGVLDTLGFETNPDGRNISLTIFNHPNARQVPLDTSKVDFFILNGGSDEAGIDVVRADSSIIMANNIEYGDTSPYSEMLPRLFQFNVTEGNNPNLVLASYRADLSLLTGKTLAVFTSGFADSAINNNGPSLGMFAATSDGNVIQFPLIQATAKVQFIHNSVEPLLYSTTIYINGNEVVNELKFRQATPFAYVPAGTTINIGIAPSASTSVADTLKNIAVTLAPNSTNVLMLEGLIDTTGFAFNPDGRNIHFTIRVIDSVQTKASQAGMVDIRMALGVPDEPANDFILDNILPPIYDNLNYGDVSGYYAITPAKHTLYMSPHGDDTLFTKQYEQQFSSYTGTSLTIFTSGFINPAANENGPAFWIWGADTSGITFPLTDLNSIINFNSINYINIYPNPASDYTIVFNKENERVLLQLMDITGKEVTELGYLEGNSCHSFPLPGIANGIYLIRVTSANREAKELKLVIQR